MSMNDFEKGMSAGAGAFEAPLQRSAEEIKEVGKNIGQWVDRYGEVVDAVLKDLGDKEMQDLYGMQPKEDLADMDESEQKLLVEMLLTIINETDAADDEKTALRQVYLTGLKQYVSYTEPKPLPDFSRAAGNVSDLHDHHMMLQSISECLYLGSGNYSFMDPSFEEYKYLSCFLLGREQEELDQIKNNIDIQVKSVGVNGLAQKYNCINKLKAQKRVEEKVEKPQKVSVFIISPDTNGSKTKKDSSKDLDIRAADALKHLLRGASCPVLEKGDPSCLRVYIGDTPEAQGAKGSTQRIIFEKYGCKIYAAGYNMVLDCEKIDGLDEKREEIAAYHRSLNLQNRQATLDKLDNWEKRHTETAREDFLTIKAKAATDKALGNAEALAEKLKSEDGKSAISRGKRLGGIALHTLGNLGKAVGDFATDVAELGESALDQSNTDRANASFDKNLFPKIQRDILVAKAVELILSGELFAKE